MPSTTESSSVWQTLLTVDEVEYITQELETALAVLDSTTEGEISMLFDTLRPNTTTLLKLHTGLSVDECRKTIQEYLKEFKQPPQIVTLEVSQEPAWGMVKLIAGRIKQRLGERVIIRFSYNPSLIGGAAVTWQGKYFDGSLRGLLDALSNRKTANPV